MALKGVRDISNAIERDGKFHYAYAFKATMPTPVVAGRFIDTSQSTGIPKFNSYVGDALGATPLTGSVNNNGLYPGNFISGSSKHLARWQAQLLGNVVPANLMLLDYLMFYPLIDGDSVDEQTMDNTLTIPRYSHGQVMLVCSVGGAQNGAGTMNYYNQDGVLKTTNFFVGTPGQYTISTTAVLNGSTDFCPFIPLASGDIGVSAIDSITFSVAPGGFFTATIVKPLATLPILEQAYAAEKQFPFQQGQAIEIKQGAYLNFIAKCGAVAVSALRAELLFINS